MDDKQKRLNVGLFLDTFFPMIDGVIVVVDNLARRLAKYCNVTVFVPDGRKKFDDLTLPYKVVRCKKKFPLIFLDYDMPLPGSDKDFKAAIKNSHLDIVHIHSPFNICTMAVKYAKKNNIPIVGTLHSQYKLDFKRAVKFNFAADMMVRRIMRTINSCDECWPVNDGIDDLFIKEYRLTAKTKIHYNATDFVKIDFTQKDFDEMDQKYHIAGDEKVFMFVGRINKLKNIFFIADSLKILKERGFKFKMFFIGSGADEKRLIAKLKKEKLQDSVVLTGKVSDRNELAKFYARSDLFLFPSKYDTDGLIKYEGACYNTPTLLLKGVHCSSNVTDNVNGYLSEATAQAYADKIVDIFSDMDKYNEVCKRAHQDLYRTWDDSVAQTLKDYYRIIEEKKLAIAKAAEEDAKKSKKSKKSSKASAQPSAF